MNYSKDFLPNRGDRVAFKDGFDNHKGRVVGYSDDEVVIRHVIHGYFTKKWNKVIFLHNCPWWAFWQK